MIFQICLVGLGTLVGPSLDPTRPGPDVDPPGVTALAMEHHPPRRSEDDDGRHQTPGVRPGRPTQQMWLHALALAFDGVGGSSSFRIQSTVARTIAFRSLRPSTRPFHTSRRMVARTPGSITVVRSSSLYLPFISTLPWQHGMERPIGPIRDALQVRPALDRKSVV